MRPLPSPSSCRPKKADPGLGVAGVRRLGELDAPGGLGQEPEKRSHREPPHPAPHLSCLAPFGPYLVKRLNCPHSEALATATHLCVWGIDGQLSAIVWNALRLSGRPEIVNTQLESLHICS